MWLFVGGDEVDCGSKDRDEGRGLYTGGGVGKAGVAPRRVDDGHILCCCQGDDASGRNLGVGVIEGPNRIRGGRVGGF